MDSVRRELDRLRRGWRATRARDLAAAVHLVLLFLAVLVVLGHRILGPWALLAPLERPWPAVLLTALAAGLVLWLLGPLLRLLLPRFMGVSQVDLARTLDDSLTWGDAVDTTLGLDETTERPVEVFLGAQTTGRLRGVEAKKLWPRRIDGRWPRRILLFLFVFLLVAPGVLGGFGQRGAGRGDEPGLGTRPDPRPQDAVDADRWLREHGRLLLRAPAAKEKPLELVVRFRTDRPLPEAYVGDLEVLWDGEGVGIGTLQVPAGERADETLTVDLATIEALAELRTPGRHVAQARLTPTQGPWEAPLESNRLIVVLEEGGGGGEGEGPPEPEPAPDPQPDPQPQPEPQPQPPPPEPPPPPPAPEGEDDQPAPPVPDEGRLEVVDPLVRDDAHLVEKEEAVVAMPDPEAGLEPPPLVPLEEAMKDFERVVERAMGDERVRGREKDFLLRYFQELRRRAEGGAR